MTFELIRMTYICFIINYLRAHSVHLDNFSVEQLLRLMFLTDYTNRSIKLSTEAGFESSLICHHLLTDGKLNF